MTLLDMRPARLDLYVRPGDDYSVILTWPETLDDRTFEATLLAADLAVDVVDTVMTIVIPDDVTDALISGATWSLRETTAGSESDVTLITGRVIASRSGTSSVARAATIELASLAVSVSVVGGVTGDIAALEAADVALAAGLGAEVTRASTQENLKLAKDSNLSDVANPAMALANLGGIGLPAGPPTVGQMLVVISVGPPPVLAWADPGAPLETFSLLTESGNTLITEAGNTLVLEAA